MPACKAIVATCRLLDMESTGCSYPLLLPQDHHLNESQKTSKRLLPTTARLGLPLYYCATAELTTKQQDMVDGAIDKPHTISPTNQALRNFSVKKCPPNKHPIVMDMPGNFTFWRADGADFELEQFIGMFCFIEDEMRALADIILSDPEIDTYEPFHACMTPEKFAEWWSCQEGCDGVGFPVELGCKACGKEDDGKLMRCGKCRVVKYCGTDCQKGDWSKHKKLCVKA